MALAENISFVKVVEKPEQVAQSSPLFVPPAASTGWRCRHYVLGISFLLCVCLPIALCGWYLSYRAVDQFSSSLAFSVRSEKPASGLEMLGGMASLSGAGANDNDILFDYLNSQALVERLDQSLDLKDIWSRAENDPYFSFDAAGHIEDLHQHWQQKVSVSYDVSRGIIDVQTLAFDPAEAKRINEAILLASTDLINPINNIARDDTVRYALSDFQRARAQLTEARRALTEFRIQHEFVNPTQEAEAQARLVAELESQLTQTLVEVEILSANARRDDPRIGQALLKADVLKARIAEERGKWGQKVGYGAPMSSAELYGTYEQLQGDVEFAQERYQTARAGFDAAMAEARRDTRYLAAHVLPTLAQSSLYPKRGLILGLTCLALISIWCIGALVVFSLLDRR